MATTLPAGPAPRAPYHGPVHPLVALDLPLGPELEAAIRGLVDQRSAFCVLDQRLAPRAQERQLAALGATHVLDRNGRHDRRSGQGVDQEVGLVMLTSGSSGEPKAAELTWDALAASARITQATLRQRGERPVWFPVLPPSHIGGLAVILRAVLDEADLWWGDDTDFAAARRAGVTHLSVVRTHLARHSVEGFTAVLVGGARPPADRPPNVIATWGMTETGSGVVYNGTALPEVELAIVEGELLVRSPTLLRSYRTQPRPAATGPDGRTDWFPTGDAAELHEGRLHVHGRIGWVIVTGGEKVWPDDLEAALATVSGVRDVAVTGIADPEWGQRVLALVVGEGTNLDDALRAAAAERIGPWAKPKEIRYVAALPRTATGKIRRHLLATLG